MIGACLVTACEGTAICDGISSRAPSIPVFVSDPYMNLWVNADKLTEDSLRLWDGTRKSMVGMLRLNGVSYRWLGGPDDFSSDPPPALLQNGFTVVAATSTTARFSIPDPAFANLTLAARFVTPRVPKWFGPTAAARTPFRAASLREQWMSLSSPVNVVELSFEVAGAVPPVMDLAVYLDLSSEVAVNTDDEPVLLSTVPNSHLTVVKLGTAAQNVLGTKGDRIGIDWGFAYLAASSTSSASTATACASSTSNLGSLYCIRSAFCSQQSQNCSTPQPSPPSAGLPGASIVQQLASLPSAPLRFYFGYDEIFSIDWFGTPLSPLWRAEVATASDDPFVPLLESFMRTQEATLAECALFDQLVSQLSLQAGGAEYCALTSLAYRQTLGALKVVLNPSKLPWVFLKEISSNGDVNTVDVIFPASPQLLYFCPWMLEGLIEPILVYANNGTNVTYNQVFAPHQLGTYPIAYITTAGQENMPIEESGNLLLNLASLALNYDSPRLIKDFWPLLLQWANYLVTVLPDPGFQLSTDDFEGPSPHNVNLAAKGILALRVFSDLCTHMGEAQLAFHFWNVSELYLANWTLSAFTVANASQPHYKLQYNLPGTWSLKYNIFQQQLFQLDFFPRHAVIDVELNYYLDRQMHPYGIPLDDRAQFSKWDWEAWVSAMASSQEQFSAINHKLFLFANETLTRVPLSDWYSTITGLQHLPQHGFQARPVVGGIYCKLLIIDHSFFTVQKQQSIINNNIKSKIVS
ncbi:MAG: DUF4965 domain-containing protein [archaeon]|nr:DUF4965 domain-containing protein [archaeon]